MAGFDGNGNFDLYENWPGKAGDTIQSNHAQTQFQAIKTGFENVITRDGQNQPSSDLPMGGYRHSGVGDAVVDTNYISRKQYKENYGWLKEYGLPTDGVTVATTAISNALATVGQNKFVFPKGLFKIDGATVNDGIIVPSNKWIQFAPGSVLVSANTGSENPLTEVRPQGFNMRAAAPTEWFALTADALTGTHTITTNKSYEKWDYVEVISNKLLTQQYRGNSRNIRQGQCFQIIKKTGSSAPYTYELDMPFEYDFTTDDNAVVGKYVPIKNVVIEMPNVGTDNIDSLIGFGASLKYCENIHIYCPTIIGTKQPLVPRVRSFSAIRIGSGCWNIHIYSVNLRYIEWYGIDFSGNCCNIFINGGVGIDCSHFMSVNHTIRPSGYADISIAAGVGTVTPDSYGEPKYIYWNNLIGIRSELSTFDTHDVGDQIFITDCVSRDSGDDACQVRTRGVTLSNFVSEGSYLDGVSVNIGAYGTKIKNGIKISRAGRLGINSGYHTVDIDKPVIIECGWGMNNNGEDIISGGGGILTLGGSINEPEFINNKGNCIIHSSVQAYYSPEHPTNPNEAIPNTAWSKQQPLVVSGVKNTRKYDSPPSWANAAHGTAGQNCLVHFDTQFQKYSTNEIIVGNSFEIPDDDNLVDFQTTPQLCLISKTAMAWGFGDNLFTCTSGYRPDEGVGIRTDWSNSFYDPDGSNPSTGVPYNVQGVFTLAGPDNLGASATVATGMTSHIPTTGITLPIISRFEPYIITAVNNADNRRGALHWAPLNGTVVTVRSTTRGDDAETDGAGGIEKSNKSDSCKYGYNIWN